MHHTEHFWFFVTTTGSPPPCPQRASEVTASLCHCPSMAARQRHALEPAQEEVQPEMPELGRCELRRVMIASEPGGRLEEHEVVVAEER